MNTSPSAEARRPCPFCAESVPAAARLCPRCRQWLTWRSLRHPGVNLLLVGLPMMAGFLALLAMLGTGFERLFNPRPFYSEVPGALEVLQSQFNWVETSKGPRLYVTGILTNHSAFGWKSVEFECRFFDTNLVMVDADNRFSFVTVEASDDSAFRVVVEPARPREAYHSVQVAVATARSARSAF
jgi:hypothetical protein